MVIWVKSSASAELRLSAWANRRSRGRHCVKPLSKSNLWFQPVHADKTAPARRFIRIQRKKSRLKATMIGFRRSLALALLVGAVAAGAASAQLLPSVPVPDIGGPVGGVINDVGSSASRTVGESVDRAGVGRKISSAEVRSAAAPSLQRLISADWVQNAPPLALSELRKLRLEQLVTDNRATLEMDGAGNPVKRGRLIAVDPPADAVPLAVRAGFTVASDERDELLGIRVVAFTIPRGMKLRQAAEMLRRLSPQLDIDFDHIFEPAGGA